MDINALWSELEREGEDSVRRKFHQGLYGLPGSVKRQQVEGWLKQKDWERSNKNNPAAPPTLDTYDDLLRLLHRRGTFDQDIKEQAELSTAEGSPVSLILLDPDKFKAINDEYGHPVGDQVLVALSEVVASRTKAKGRAYRYGGDEMAILLPNYSTEEALTLAELIRRAVEVTPLTNQQFQMTASFGVATLPDHAIDSEALKKHADEALYQAKRLGRNLVRKPGEPETVQSPSREVKRRQPDPAGLSE